MKSKSLVGVAGLAMAGLATGFLLASAAGAQQEANVHKQDKAEAAPASAPVPIDPKLPEYKPVSGVSGSLKSVGSDTMNNLMTFWAEGFRQVYPDVQVEIEGKGSNTAPAALISGAAQFGPMSREMKNKELDEFEKQFGYKPTGLPTSLDMLAVYVNKDNPLQSLTLAQVDAIFSKNRKAGFPKNIRTWGEVGLTGEWANKPISIYGRNAASGTYVYFKEHVLKGGDYKDSVKEQVGSAAVVQAVASDRYAIGYSGIGYKTSDVRAVPLAANDKSKAIGAVLEYAYTGDYPLARFLFLYVNRKPGGELDPLRREFIRYVFSKEGQQVVVKDGYFPLPATLASESLDKVGLGPKN